MRWTAIVPLKTGSRSKSRLAGILDAAQREALAMTMARHVIACLATSAAIERIILLSPAPVDGIAGEWARDEGRGLNRECDAILAVAPERPHLLILGDLPQLTVDDVTALLGAAESAGAAIAPDRHGTGTNAIALRTPGVFTCAFGTGSFDAHARMLGTGVAIVRRQGLAHDIDEPDDLATI